MKKIVINTCYGGFGLSNIAVKRYLQLTNKECFFYQSPGLSSKRYKKSSENDSNMWTFIFVKDFGESFDGNTIPNYWDYHFSDYEISRDDPCLIQVVEELRDKASGDYASLKIIEIPDVEWEIDEYDGIETIHEKHRSWK